MLGFYFFAPNLPAQFQTQLTPGVLDNTPRVYEAYSFESLRTRQYPGSEIKLEKIIAKKGKYTSWLFSFLSDGQRVTGMANLPEGKGSFPVIVMLRGHVDDEVYFTGAGTHKAAGVLAQNGFVTLAPDFLGFGGSDSSSADILEARFTRPVTVLNLLAAIEKFPRLTTAPGAVIVDPKRVGLWAHSNGGQIALSVLEISRQPWPTTLWAPVTKGFPESILAFMGEMDDQGRLVKKVLDDFLADYQPELYSIDHYFGDISAPLQLHQGGQDNLVPASWSQDFVKTMASLGKKVDYYYYPRADHNLKQNWDQVVARDISFFKTNLSN